MNDQALAKSDAKGSSYDVPRRTALIGPSLRLMLLAAILVGGIFLVFKQFQNHSSVQESVIVDESESVAIVESPNNIDEATEVPLSAITACINQEVIDEAEHPLQPLIEMAKYAEEVITSNVIDYTATLTKRLRVKGRLQPEEKMFIKIRHEVEKSDPEESVPFSVYTKFLDPKKGQEAIWVDGANNNKLVAHGPSGLLNLMTVRLDPQGKMAMNGNRHPIWTIGMLNLIKLMIEKAETDLHYDDCRVELARNVMLGESNCTRLVIIHDQPQDHFEYHRVEIYIDDERNLPIGFRSYDWPNSPGGKPRLLERYYYTNIKLNVGLEGNDFDPANEAYDYPGM